MLRRFASFLPLLLAACSVDSTVGYVNEPLLSGSACRADALARCESDVCAVTNVFDAPSGAITLVADDSDLFFLADPVTIDRHRLAGGPDVELASAGSTLIRMAGDAANLYWTELDGNVRGIAKAGGARFDAGYVFGNPTDIALDGSFLYWIFPEFGQVAMAPKPSGEATHISGQSSPQAIATDRTHVYWVNAGSGPGAGELMRGARGELTTAGLVLSGLDAPIALAVGDDAVYWASKTAVYRLIKGDTEVQTVATGFSEVKAIGVYGSTLYGVGMEGLWRVPAVGGEWQQLERRAMSGLAIACSGVYATGWFERALVRYGP